MLKLTGAPRMHRGQSKQVDWPYRYARPFIFRLPLGNGIAIGWWRDHDDLDIGRHLAECMVLGAIPSDGDTIQGDGDAWIGTDGPRLEVDTARFDHIRMMCHKVPRPAVTVL